MFPFPRCSRSGVISISDNICFVRTLDTNQCVSDSLEGLIADGRTNAAIAWALVAAIAIVGVSELVTGGFLWAMFAATLVTLALLPPVSFRSSRHAPLGGVIARRSAGPRDGHRCGSTDRSLRRVPLRRSHRAGHRRRTPVLYVRPNDTPFAVVFVVVTTMAAAGVWAVLRWEASQTLGYPVYRRPRCSDVGVRLLRRSRSRRGHRLRTLLQTPRLAGAARLENATEVAEGDDA